MIKLKLEETKLTAVLVRHLQCDSCKNTFPGTARSFDELRRKATRQLRNPWINRGRKDYCSPKCDPGDRRKSK